MFTCAYMPLYDCACTWRWSSASALPLVRCVCVICNSTVQRYVLWYAGSVVQFVFVWSLTSALTQTIPSRPWKRQWRWLCRLNTGRCTICMHTCMAMPSGREWSAQSQGVDSPYCPMPWIKSVKTQKPIGVLLTGTCCAKKNPLVSQNSRPN